MDTVNSFVPILNVVFILSVTVPILTSSNPLSRKPKFYLCIAVTSLKEFCVIVFLICNY